MISVDMNSLRHLPRRSSKNCDLQFANCDRLKENYSIDEYRDVFGEFGLKVKHITNSYTYIIAVIDYATYNCANNCDKFASSTIFNE